MSMNRVSFINLPVLAGKDDQAAKQVIKSATVTLSDKICYIENLNSDEILLVANYLEALSPGLHAFKTASSVYFDFGRLSDQINFIIHPTIAPEIEHLFDTIFSDIAYDPTTDQAALDLSQLKTVPKAIILARYKDFQEACGIYLPSLFFANQLHADAKMLSLFYFYTTGRFPANLPHNTIHYMAANSAPSSNMEENDVNMFVQETVVEPQENTNVDDDIILLEAREIEQNTIIYSQPMTFFGKNPETPSTPSETDLQMNDASHPGVNDLGEYQSALENENSLLNWALN